jgi:hypothetical protein
MNAALAMVKKLSDEFEEAYPRFKESDEEYMHIKILSFLYKGYVKVEEGPTFLEEGKEDEDPLTYRQGGQILHPSTVMCTHTTDLICKLFLNKSQDLRLSNDEKRFLKCVSQLGSAFGAPKMPHNNDMVYNAAGSLVRNNNLNSWVVFSLQIFWDTQRELGPNLSLGDQLLRKTAQQLATNYQIYLDTKGLERVGIMHKTFRKDMIGRKKEVDIIANGTYFQTCADECEKRVPWRLGDFPGFCLMACHPGLCGLTLAQIQDQYHTTSTNFAADQAQVLVSAHLYNAVHRIGLLPSNVRWADMDWLIEHQGSGWLFVGEKPKIRH